MDANDQTFDYMFKLLIIGKFSDWCDLQTCNWLHALILSGVMMIIADITKLLSNFCVVC